MNKYIDAEKLKAEIERRRLQNRYIDTDGYEEELLEIIDSLQQEQPEVDLEEDETVTDCNELEEAAEKIIYDAVASVCKTDNPRAFCQNNETVFNVAKAVAKRQREQDHYACRQCEKDYDNVFYKGEQHAIEMMKKEAIEGKCIDVWMAGVVIDTDYGCLYLPPNTFEIGDMVKIIILKDE